MKRLLLSFLLLCGSAHAQNQMAGSLTISNTGGAGFVQIANQSSAPSTPTAAGRVYFDSGNDLAWKEAGGFVGVIDLGGASRAITLSGSPTLGDWFDQSVKQAASPSFNRLTSTVATGTAPFTVSSTTNVANLNASSLSGATFAAPGPIGSGTPSTGAFTTVSASGQITSTLATGTAPLVIASTTNVPNLNASSLGGATFAAPGTIGGGTPGSGSFTTVVATGTITPSQTAGIVGTTTNNNADAGSVGEYVSSTVLAGSAVTLTATITSEITSIALTAGDWDVSAMGWIVLNGTTNAYAWAGISSSNSGNPGTFGNPDNNFLSFADTAATANAYTIPVPPVRVSISTDGSRYLLIQSNFTGTANTAYGSITARRVR
jgi:hypothetical protein